MTAAVVVIAIVVVVAVAAVIGMSRRRRVSDGVDSFRRQIDALSPEARRPVVDQVQRSAGRPDPDEPDPDEPEPSAPGRPDPDPVSPDSAREATSDGGLGDAAGDDEDGARGS